MERRKRKAAVAVICTVVCLFIAGAATYGICHCLHKDDNPPENVVSDGAFDGMKDSSVKSGLNEKQAKHMVTLNILNSITWKNADSYADVGIYNPRDSRYVLQVVLASEDGDVVYKSPKLNADQKVESAKLTNKGLKPGTYNCTADFNFYDEQSGELQTKQSIQNIKVILKEKS